MGDHTSFGWALLLKPFFLLVFFFAVYLIARAIHPLIPAGRVKALLYDKGLRERHPWKFGLGFLAGGWVIAGIVGAFVYWFR